MARIRRYTEHQVREAVATSLSVAESLRKLGLRPAGGNRLTLKKLIEQYGLSTEHFDPTRAQRMRLRHRPPTPLDELLVEHSTYHRGHLKQRLYDAGLKSRKCELCGQGELWRGRPMALILDHINGIGTDNRLENLQIVCPNCAATLDTHCGRNRPALTARECLRCGTRFHPASARQRYCSKSCGLRNGGCRGVARPERRKVSRPSYEQLTSDLESMSFLAVGRKYGVSDNAVRKWIRCYERDE